MGIGQNPYYESGQGSMGVPYVNYIPNLTTAESWAGGYDIYGNYIGDSPAYQNYNIAQGNLNYPIMNPPYNVAAESSTLASENTNIPFSWNTTSSATPAVTTPSTSATSTSATSSTNPYDIQTAMTALISSLTQPTSTANTGYTSSGFSGAYGFPATDRDKHTTPIVYRGTSTPEHAGMSSTPFDTVIYPPGSGSTTTEEQWQAALDSIYGPRQQKTGWNTGTSW